jgi:hypothetical protein
VPIVIAAVIVVGVLCVLDLLLTFGVIRRLKEHTAMLAERGSGSLAPPVIGLAEGERPGAFSATTADGQRVDEGTPYSAAPGGLPVHRVFHLPRAGAAAAEVSGRPSHRPGQRARRGTWARW